MYVVFEQRERGQQGSSFVDGAWDRFYRDLDVILRPMVDLVSLASPEAPSGESSDGDIDGESIAEPGAA
jgi:hypothetical protein